MKKIASFIAILALGVALTGCPALNNMPKFLIQKASVESIEMQILESFPVQVRAVVRGYIGDGCTEIYQITKRREDRTFFIDILTRRPADAICIQIAKAFEESITLYVFGLDAGTYTVSVNGTLATFKLEAPNRPTSQP